MSLQDNKYAMETIQSIEDGVGTVDGIVPAKVCVKLYEELIGEDKAVAFKLLYDALDYPTNTPASRFAGALANCVTADITCSTRESWQEHCAEVFVERAESGELPWSCVISDKEAFIDDTRRDFEFEIHKAGLAGDPDGLYKYLKGLEEDGEKVYDMDFESDNKDAFVNFLMENDIGNGNPIDYVSDAPNPYTEGYLEVYEDSDYVLTIPYLDSSLGEPILDICDKHLDACLYDRVPLNMEQILAEVTAHLFPEEKTASLDTLIADAGEPTGGVADGKQRNHREDR